MLYLPLGAEHPPKRFPYLTVGIICLNLAVQIYLFFVDDERYCFIINFFGWDITNPFPFYIITSQFLHADWWHCLSNMVFLWTFGAYLESVLSPKQFLFYYFGSAMAGGVLSSAVGLIFQPGFGAPAIGASDAISGLMGVWMVRCYYNKVKLGVSLYDLFGWIPKRLKINPWILIGYYFCRDLHGGLTNLVHPHSHISYWAHIGGLIFGVVMAWRRREHWKAQVEHCRVRARYWLDQNIGFGQIRRDLNTVISREPSDAWALVDLARVETHFERTPRGQDSIVAPSWLFGSRAKETGPPMCLRSFSASIWK